MISLYHNLSPVGLHKVFPQRPMRQWSRLPQYRQIPVEIALNVRHDVVRTTPEDFVHMGFLDAGAAHDV